MREVRYSLDPSLLHFEFDADAGSWRRRRNTGRALEAPMYSCAGLTPSGDPRLHLQICAGAIPRVASAQPRPRQSSAPSESAECSAGQECTLDDSRSKALVGVWPYVAVFLFSYRARSAA